MLTDQEKQLALQEVRDLIESANQQAVLLRAVSGELLYGTDSKPFTELGGFPFEWVSNPSLDLGKQADAKASVLPDLDIREQDHVVFEGETYRVQTIKPQDFFGITTHQVVQLVRLYGRN